MKIYDCFSYLDEDLLLELRLNILNRYIDHFVIVEGNKTWQNNPKKLKFDINKFQKFKDKIIYIIVDKQPPNILQLIEEESKEKRGEKLILNGNDQYYCFKNYLNWSNDKLKILPSTRFSKSIEPI